MDHSGWISLTERPPTAADGEYVLVWHVYQGTMALRREDCRKNPFNSHWRPIPAEGWIDTQERKPTAEDGDVWKCVLAHHTTDGFKVTGWHQFEWDPDYTHWMHTPEPPDDYIELRK